MPANLQMFSKEEKEILEQLSLQIGNDVASYPKIERILDEEKITEILQGLVDEGHFPNLFVAGSQFMKRYGIMTIAPIFFAFTMWNKRIEAGPDQLGYRIEFEQDSWTMKLAVRNEWIGPENRTDARAKLANELINQNLAPFVETMVKATKLSATILWENAAIYLFWIYETLIPSKGNEEQKQRAKEDFHYIVHQFQCTSFTCGTNPFLPYYTEKKERAEGTMRTRKTCCLRDQISPDTMCCKTCPKLRG
ncbi:siderophore-iron reductase FhuF [Alkalihalobacillus macyae]|uniref:siderophore-iron reductase FhuF n=1 Tax=Guptibacillus hwajinpoensis TaxID=208199 RepID=UPI00273AB4A1|nr:siderophore-iron reductase FhuF [Alkalihalobacillus macyae]MDP4553435.1 siderophore-iron reductase FhuF [Alkalihalobacillus macyae]